MDPSIVQKLAELTEAAESARVLQTICQRFPDLKIHTNRWNKKRYTSKAANAICDQYDIRHNCGCCNDSPIELWPYVEVEGVEVYADGIPFVIGEKYPWIGEKPYDGWQAKLRSAGIQEAIVEKVQRYFDENPPQDLVE